MAQLRASLGSVTDAADAGAEQRRARSASRDR